MSSVLFVGALEYDFELCTYLDVVKPVLEYVDRYFFGAGRSRSCSSFYLSISADRALPPYFVPSSFQNEKKYFRGANQFSEAAKH